MSADTDIAELLAAYAAGELADEDRARVERALDRSPRLQAELAQYRQLFVLLAATSMEDVTTPAGLEGRIIGRIAVQWYLDASLRLIEDVLGAYGRALIYYLRLA